jgi:sigma-B regulation protein RsbU (phosphoserine phosphatase)
MYRLKCAEVWGGIKDEELDVCSRGLTVSLFSSACDGGKGGDVYFCSVCRGDRVTRVAVADVVGHGEIVSEVGRWVHDELVEGMDDPVLANLLSDLNGRVTARGLEAMTTAVALSYDMVEHLLEYGYAGHPPIFVRRGSAWADLPPAPGDGRQNLPLGVDRTCPYRTSGVTAASGDLLLLYTDGVLEAPSPSGELFGQDRLYSLLRGEASASPSELKSRLLTSLRNWTGGRLDHDDVTLLAVEVA